MSRASVCSSAVVFLLLRVPWCVSCVYLCAHRPGRKRSACQAGGGGSDCLLDGGERCSHDVTSALVTTYMHAPSHSQQHHASPRVAAAAAVTWLQAKDIPVEYVLYPDEGHGFARPVNRIDFNGRTEALLQRSHPVPCVIHSLQEPRVTPSRCAARTIHKSHVSLRLTTPVCTACFRPSSPPIWAAAPRPSRRLRARPQASLSRSARTTMRQRSSCTENKLTEVEITRAAARCGSYHATRAAEGETMDRSL